MDVYQKTILLIQAAVIVVALGLWVVAVLVIG